MPTYEYVCRECGEHLEVAQSFKDDPLTTCPNCGGRLRKVFGTIGIAFKGSGFYRTDSRAAAKTAAKSGDAPKSGDGDKVAKAGESKPAAGSGESGPGSAKATPSGDNANTSSKQSKPDTAPAASSSTGGGRGGGGGKAESA